MLDQSLKLMVYAAVMIGVSSAHAGAYEDLLSAVENDDPSTVTRLIDRGLDPNTRAPNGQPVLTLALQKESGKVAGVLAAASTLDTEATTQAGETPLMMAAIKGRVDVARRLLDRGAKLDRTGWAPIHYAASGPSLEMLKLLLDRGATIDAPSPNATTALMMAARYGTEDAVQLLLERGADPKRRNEKGLGCADFARLAGREALTARLLALQQ